MRLTHLLAGLVALGLLAVGSWGVTSVEDARVADVAHNWWWLGPTPVAFQRAAVRAPDLLPVFGSSEVAYGQQGHAAHFFADRPTGFAIFPVAQEANSPYIMLQQIAALGADLGGKKLVISVTPNDYIKARMDPVAYAHLYQPAKANAFLFHPSLSLDVKVRAARLMQAYPATLEHDPLLRLVVNLLAQGTALSRLGYMALWPFGVARDIAYRLQDQGQALGLLWTKHARLEPAPPPTPRELHWNRLAALGERRALAASSSNTFGFDNDFWAKRGDEILRQQGTLSDAAYLRDLQSSETWEALDVLLTALTEMNARPLLLSAPVNGDYSDFTGVSPAARASYYAQMEDMGRRHGIPVVTFADHDEDASFSIDPSSHPSRKGWIFYDRALNAFWHDKPLDRVGDLAAPDAD